MNDNKTHKRLTKSDKDYILREISSGETISAVAKRVGVSTASISQFINKHHPELRRIRRPIDKNILFTYIERGMTATEISNRIGYPVGTIYSAAFAMGVKFKSQSSEKSGILA